MKREQRMARVCEIIKKETELIVRVHLAERWCGYDIVRISECSGKKECGLEHCDSMNVEEEKVIDQLILDYFEQQNIREKIREDISYSNF